MSKSVIEQCYDCFNNQDLDGFTSFFHKNIKVYDLKTNELQLEGKKVLREINVEPVQNEQKKIYARNVVVRENFEFFYKCYSYRGNSEIVILELSENLIKNVWVASYESI